MKHGNLRSRAGDRRRIGRRSHLPVIPTRYALLVPPPFRHGIAQRKNGLGQHHSLLIPLHVIHAASSTSHNTVQHPQRHSHDGKGHQQLQQGKSSMSSDRAPHGSKASWLTRPDSQSTRKRTPEPDGRSTSTLPPVAPPEGKKRTEPIAPGANSLSATIIRTCKGSGKACAGWPSTPYWRFCKSTEKRISRPWDTACDRAERISLSIVRTVFRYCDDSLMRP